MTHPTQEVIELAERHSQAAAAFSLAGLEDSRKRAHALLLLLLGGAGALGSVGLAKIETSHIIGWTALCCAAYWFALAAYVAYRGATSDPARSWATPGLLEQYPKWKAWEREELAELKESNCPTEERPQPDAAVELRRSAIRNCELAGEEYRTASEKTFGVVDAAYRLAALTPCVGALAAAVTVVADHWG